MKNTSNKLRFLSRREKEVYHYLSLGKSSKQIAAILFISLYTVKNHRCNILRKLDVPNTAALMRVGT